MDFNDNETFKSSNILNLVSYRNGLNEALNMVKPLGICLIQPYI